MSTFKTTMHAQYSIDTETFGILFLTKYTNIESYIVLSCEPGTGAIILCLLLYKEPHAVREN
jgi:hypothetical protein